MPDKSPSTPADGTRPTDDAIVVAALGTGREWQYADEIRGQLRCYGFDASHQQVIAWLGRLTREDSPMIERERRYGQGDFEYRVTRFGKTQVGNHFPGLRAHFV